MPIYFQGWNGNEFRFRIGPLLLIAEKMNTEPKPHETVMTLALEQAKKAGQMGEVPIGAVIVAQDGQVLAEAHNQPIAACDPTAHAEILALRAAARMVGNYRLSGATLYVTIEPCLMCMGALVHARLARVVYGARDEKWGAAGSLYNFGADRRLNHTIEIVPGILYDVCRDLMRNFFKQRRS